MMQVAHFGPLHRADRRIASWSCAKGLMQRRRRVPLAPMGYMQLSKSASVRGEPLSVKRLLFLYADAPKQVNLQQAAVIAMRWQVAMSMTDIIATRIRALHGRELAGDRIGMCRVAVNALRLSSRTCGIPTVWKPVFRTETLALS